MVKKIQKKKAIAIAKFLIRLNLLLIPFYLIIYFEISWLGLQHTLTLFIAKIFSWLGYSTRVSGILLFVGDKVLVDMSFDCIGWKSMYSLFALVFAVKEKIKKKMKFLLKWLPVLFGLNLIRIVSNIFIGLKYGPKYMEIAHTIFWQIGMIGMVLVIWWLWLKKVKT